MSKPVQNMILYAIWVLNAMVAVMIILFMMFLTGCGTTRHHDNDRCLYDQKVRYSQHSFLTNKTHIS